MVTSHHIISSDHFTNHILTSPHNKPRCLISPQNRPHDIMPHHITAQHITTTNTPRKTQTFTTTTTKWSGSRLVRTKNSAWAALADLRTVYKQILSLAYRAFLLTLPGCRFLRMTTFKGKRNRNKTTEKSKRRKKKQNQKKQKEEMSQHQMTQQQMHQHQMAQHQNSS